MAVRVKDRRQRATIPAASGRRAGISPINPDRAHAAGKGVPAPSLLQVPQREGRAGDVNKFGAGFRQQD